MATDRGLELGALPDLASAGGLAMALSEACLEGRRHSNIAEDRA